MNPSGYPHQGFPRPVDIHGLQHFLREPHLPGHVLEGGQLFIGVEIRAVQDRYESVRHLQLLVDGGNGVLHFGVVGQDVRHIIPQVLIEPFRLQVEFLIPKVLDFIGEVDLLVVAFCLEPVYAVPEMLQLRGFPFILGDRCRAVIGGRAVGIHVLMDIILTRPQDFVPIILYINVGIRLFLVGPVTLNGSGRGLGIYILCVLNRYSTAVSIDERRIPYMKISDIKLRNFKGIKELEVRPGKINILSGPNGMGKTSLMEGMRCAITGKIPEDYMAMGAVKASVAVEVGGIGSIERQYTPSKSTTRMCGKVTTAKDVTKVLGDMLGCSAKTMNMMFSSELMEEMMGADLAGYLLNEGFLKNDMDIEKLLSLCSLSEEAEKELRMLLPEAPERITLGDIQEAYDMCFASRAERERGLAEAEAAAKYAGNIPTRSVAEINKEQQEIA